MKAKGVSEIMRLREQPCQAGGAVAPRERVCSEGTEVWSAGHSSRLVSVSRVRHREDRSRRRGKSEPERVSF